MEKPFHILVIDDDPMLRLVIITALQAAGFSISEAALGEEGLHLFSEKGADAILLDVVMLNGMDGFETCAALRKLPGGQHVPVLMMTGLDDLESVNRAFEAGATDFITKPINIPLLAHRVRYMLRASHTTKCLLESEQSLHRMAYFDSLTALPNRRFFKEHLQHIIALAQRQKRKLGILFLDLDGFKRINESSGHNLGDLVLQAIGERLRNCIRASDALMRADATSDEPSLARLGGDEFTILLSNIERDEDAAIVAERIRINLAQPLKTGDYELYMTTSIGIATYPNDGQTAEELLKNADLAMNHAKRGGGNRYRYFSAKMSESALHRLSLESSLRKAIERGEFELHYQPQLDIATNQFCALEALIRWNSQALGRIAPDNFIPLAEETGLIISIGEWVLRTACQQAKAWQDRGILLKRMAVNVSAMQFLHKGFSVLVATILAETGLAPHALELELTESALIRDEKTVLTVLQSLKAIGVQLAIDDFGTGYSSLSRLKHFPIDRLKIDRSFVSDIGDDSVNMAIVAAVIAMAEGMDMSVIAEGVETDSQMAFLKNKRCNELQGYFLSKPLTSAQAEAFLLQHQGK